MDLQQVVHISRASQKPSEVILDPGLRNASAYGPSVALPDLSSPLSAAVITKHSCVTLVQFNDAGSASVFTRLFFNVDKTTVTPSKKTTASAITSCKIHQKIEKKLPNALWVERNHMHGSCSASPPLQNIWESGRIVQKIFPLKNIYSCTLIMIDLLIYDRFVRRFCEFKWRYPPAPLYDPLGGAANGNGKHLLGPDIIKKHYLVTESFSVKVI